MVADIQLHITSVLFCSYQYLIHVFSIKIIILLCPWPFQQKSLCRKLVFVFSIEHLLCPIPTTLFNPELL